MIPGSTAKPLQGRGIPPAASPMPATNEGSMFQAQGDATHYAMELCRHAKNSNWLQVAIFLKKLASVDSSLVKNAFGIVKEFLDILVNSQLTIPGPLKVKFYQLLSIYTMVAYHQKAIQHESQKAEWQSLLTTALTWVNTKGHKSDDLPYLHMYRYYLECAKAVVDLTSDTHQIDWFTNAANVLSIVVSQFGLCDSQAKTVATDLFRFAKGYLQDHITESWYKVVCAVGVHQVVIMDRTVPIEPTVILTPPRTQNLAVQTNTRTQELSIAILQIQRVLSKECDKVLPLPDTHIIYACINALEQVLLRQDANDEVCKVLFYGRPDPEQPQKKLIGLEELKGYNRRGQSCSIIRSRIVELAYLLIDKKPIHLLVVGISQKIIADRKKEEKPDSKVRCVLNNKPEYFEEYYVKLQQFYPTHKSQTEESIEQLGLKVDIVDSKLSALQHSILQSQQVLADRLRRLPDYYKTRNKMDLPLGGSVLISTAFIRLTITRYTEVQQKEQVIKSTTPVTSDQQLKVYERMGEINDPIKLEQVFDLTENGLLTAQNLLISGGAGIGKSTVCQYIANQWAENKLWPEFKAVFWIPLRNLNERGYPPPKAYSLIDIINKECFQNTLSPGECTKLEALITANPEHFLVLLDGYDEVLPVARNDGYLEPALSGLIKHRFSIVTSRPGQAFGIEVTHRLEITGFTQNDIEDYITKFFAQLGDPTSARKVIDFLKQQPMIAGIAHIPLQLAMICHLVSTNELTTTVETQITLSELYHRLRHGLLKGFLTRRQTGSKLTEAELKVATQKSLEESYDDVHRVIEELGYYCILNRKIIFAKDDLTAKVKAIHPKNKDETNGAYEARIIKIVEDYTNCGILKFIKESNENTILSIQHFSNILPQEKLLEY